jgi:hypothetical protein
MARRVPRGSAPRRAEVVLDAEVAAVIRSELSAVADRTVEAIIAEVPSYADALAGSMGETIRNAVQLALSGFVTLASRTDTTVPTAPALEGAYQLGRGEARSGRTMEALLAAYRIGARVAWRDLSAAAVSVGIDAEQVSHFAQLVFAYIDELSAASAAGHTGELETSGRLRQRNLERLARALLGGADPEAITAAAERAGWEPPRTLTAVLLPAAQGTQVLGQVDARTLRSADDPAGMPEGTTVLLVPGTGSRTARAALLRSLQGTDAVVGQAVPWLEAAASYQRALRCASLDVAGPGPVDADAHLAEVLLSADPDARAALRARVLAPLADLRPSTAEKLAETLRAWLLHQGRRDAVAEALFVHPQTVRYRVGQLREAYGDRLDDPAFVLEATLALG